MAAAMADTNKRINEEFEKKYPKQQPREPDQDFASRCKSFAKQLHMRLAKAEAANSKSGVSDSAHQQRQAAVAFAATSLGLSSTQLDSSAATESP